MNRRQKIIISVTGIFLVLLILVGLTYAYFLTQIQGNEEEKSITVTTANLELTYGDGNGILLPSGLLVPSDENIKFYVSNEDTTNPTDVLIDEDGNPIIKENKTFTVTNNGEDTSYVVIIDETETKYASDGSYINEDNEVITYNEGDVTKFISNDFRYTLTCIVKDNNGSVLSSEKCNETDTKSVFPINGGILLSNKIEKEKVHEYTLTMWYIDTGIDQSKDMNKTYQARVNISDIAQMENPFKTGVSEIDNASLAYNILENSKENKNNTILVNTPLTKPAGEVSKTLYKTHDVDIDSVETQIQVSTTNQKKYWTYSTDYVVDELTGKFSLINPKVCIYNDADLTNNTDIECDQLISTMVANGENIYIGHTSIANFSNDTATLAPITNLTNIYLITNAPSSSNSSIYVMVKKVSPIEYSAETELTVAPDNYGTSYYYRGGVTDNYVNFADMCWRIVRIEGDGSIKLVLQDQYTTCNDQTISETDDVKFTGDWKLGMGNYGYIEKDVDDDSSNEYLMSYLNPEVNKEKSMVKAFYDFQVLLAKKINSNLNDSSTLVQINNTLSSKLKSGNWCTSSKAYARSGTIGNYTYTLLEDYSKTKFYEAHLILYSRSGIDIGYNLNFKCEKDLFNEFENVLDVSSAAPMYVGALNYQEIAFAGVIFEYDTVNVNYLCDYNEGACAFWSLSPIMYTSLADMVATVSDTGKISGIQVRKEEASFRPAISLNNNTIIVGGEGTIENPYVIG